ncbi:hypothetical protein L21SP2_1365 [Salinispira pacifica]|uniref:Uncharacterized protein n=1 Tax=Salinispira pacifica TaxID=1307761 RepID=V5WGS5_9SPIO|nr:hypothetical protein L21SP2_1365 [Salinispira pacifica]
MPVIFQAYPCHGYCNNIGVLCRKLTPAGLHIAQNARNCNNLGIRAFINSFSPIC